MGPRRKVAPFTTQRPAGRQHGLPSTTVLSSGIASCLPGWDHEQALVLLAPMQSAAEDRASRPGSRLLGAQLGRRAARTIRPVLLTRQQCSRLAASGIASTARPRRTTQSTSMHRLPSMPAANAKSASRRINAALWYVFRFLDDRSMQGLW